MSRSRVPFRRSRTRIVIQCFLFIWYAGRIPGSPYSPAYQHLTLASHDVSTFPFPGSPSLDWGTLITMPYHFPLSACLCGIFRFLRPRVVGSVPNVAFTYADNSSQVGINAPMCGCVLSLRMLVMGKTVNEDSTGANVLEREKRTQADSIKMGEGEFLSEKLPFPHFYACSKENGDYSSATPRRHSISCWMNAARSAGFSPSNQATQREAFSL